jgi:hypothetical protein
MGHFNQKVLGITMVLLVLAYASCTSKSESEISQIKQQTQESGMAEQEQEEQVSGMAEQEQEDQEISTTAQSPEQPSTTPEESTQAQQPSGDGGGIVTVTGTVESGLDGMTISADDGTYTVLGKDLSDMEGMTVRVTGTLKESEGLRTIEATDVVILE